MCLREIVRPREAVFLLFQAGGRKREQEFVPGRSGEHWPDYGFGTSTLATVYNGGKEGV